MKKILIMILIIVLILSVIVTIVIKSGIISFEKTETSVENTINNDVSVPEEETKEEQRTAEIKLYFINNKNEIIEEKRAVDVKLLLKDPYKLALKMLMEGPADSNNKGLIPKNTEVKDTKLEGGTLTINFSNELKKGIDKRKDVQTLMVETIYKTLKEYREVENIKIEIEGKVVGKLTKEGFDFSQEINQKLFK